MIERMIYSKASMERKPEYRQMTVLAENENGWFARKIPYGDNATEHVRRYMKNYNMLKAALIQSKKIKIIDCHENEDGTVDFPYCEEKSLADKLINMEAEAYAKTVLAFRETLEEAFGTIPFSATDEYYAVFGDAFPDGSLQSLTVSNLDMNFDNIFLKDEEYILIDYEWVMDFPVPCLFIIYRSFLSDLKFSMFSEEDQRKILDLNGINEERQKQFLKMELAFQQYVSGEYDKLESFNKIIASQALSLEEMIAFKQGYEKQRNAIHILDSQIEEYKQAYDRQQEAIKTLDDQLDEYRQAYDKQQKAIQTLNGQLKDYQEAIKTLDDQLNEYKQAYDKQQETIQTLNGQLEDHQEAIRTLDSQLDEYKQAYDKEQETIRTLCSQIDGYKQELDGIKKKWWYRTVKKFTK